MSSFQSIPVVFYKEDSGREPVKEWIFSLDKIYRKVIGKDIRTVQMGWPIGMPVVRSMGGGLWEIRSHIPNGIARIFFKMIDGEIVLLHGFIKKTQKTPKDELDLAKKRAKKYEAKNG